MIVNNEAPVIERCLASVRPWVDYWVIVDTGSTDGTQARVRKAMEGMPGELHERPWKDFSHNRNEALQLARPQADYLLFIDADEQLTVPASFTWPTLTANGYYLTCRMAGVEYQRNGLIATRLDWRWIGVLHEYLYAPHAQPWQQLPGLAIDVSHDGARARDPSTYLKDAALLEQALKDEPDNTRYAFYLAQSYRDANQYEAALAQFQALGLEPGAVLAEGAVIHRRRRHPGRARLFQPACRRVIGSNQHRTRRVIPGHRVHQRHHIRATPGNQDGDALHSRRPL